MPSSPIPQTAMPNSMTFGVTRSSQAGMPRTDRHTGSAIHPLITSRKSNHPRISEGGSPINIIEMGTGSGRCFKDLFERANDTGTPFPHVHFYGIDLSMPMLKGAMAWFDRRPALKALAPIVWVEGVDEDFTDKVPQLKGGQRSGHVDRWGLQLSVQRGAAAAFLRQMRAALRAGESSAMGLILVYSQSITSSKNPAASQVFEVPWEGRSEDKPSSLDRKSRNEVTWKGSVRRDWWDIAIWKGAAASFIQRTLIIH